VPRSAHATFHSLEYDPSAMNLHYLNFLENVLEEFGGMDSEKLIQTASRQAGAAPGPGPAPAPGRTPGDPSPGHTPGQGASGDPGLPPGPGPPYKQGNLLGGDLGFGLCFLSHLGLFETRKPRRHGFELQLESQEHCRG